MLFTSSTRVSYSTLVSICLYKILGTLMLVTKEKLNTKLWMFLKEYKWVKLMQPYCPAYGSSFNHNDRFMRILKALSEETTQRTKQKYNISTTSSLPFHAGWKAQQERTRESSRRKSAGGVLLIQGESTESLSWSSIYPVKLNLYARVKSPLMFKSRK